MPGRGEERDRAARQRTEPIGARPEGRDRRANDALHVALVLARYDEAHLDRSLAGELDRLGSEDRRHRSTPRQRSHGACQHAAEGDDPH